MSFVVAKCKHNPKKYCKNWDGKGDTNLLVSIEDGGIFKGECPDSDKTKCPFLVTPRPSPVLKAS